MEFAEVLAEILAEILVDVTADVAADVTADIAADVVADVADRTELEVLQEWLGVSILPLILVLTIYKDFIINKTRRLF